MRESEVRREHGQLSDDSQALDQAVEWYMRLASSPPTSEDEAAFASWYVAHPDHARAWQRLADIEGLLRASRERDEQFLARMGMPYGRRQVLRGLFWFGASSTTLVWLSTRPILSESLNAWTADLRTGRGERRDLTLGDGYRLQLNSDSAVDLRVQEGERRIILLRGEILLESVPAPIRRPLLVVTRDGTLRPISTRFAVRLSEGGTRLAVDTGAVEVRCAQCVAQMTQIEAGWQVLFTADRLEQPQRIDDNHLAWSEGMLRVEDMRLDELLEELRRYRHGLLLCDADVADLRITGVWSLSGSDPVERVLASVEQQLPVRIRRFTRFWARIEARA